MNLGSKPITIPVSKPVHAVIADVLALHVCHYIIKKKKNVKSSLGPLAAEPEREEQILIGANG